MTVYDRTFTFPVVFPPQPATGYIAEVLAAHELTNLRLAETEKYAHVTYFFNGGREEPFPGEDRILVPSPKVATYDLQPEMSAQGIADALIASVVAEEARRDHLQLRQRRHGRPHRQPRRRRSPRSKTVDGCLARVIPAMLAGGGAAIVTADHGNCEQMWDDTLNAPHTAHTTNPVPYIFVQGPGEANPRALPAGALCDVAPTMLGLLGLPTSKEMTGKRLV